MKLPPLLLAGLCAAAFPGLACRAQLTIPSAIYNSGQTATLIGPNTLQAGGVSGSSVTVAGGASVTYQAESAITLLPGFSAGAGSVFQAQLTGSLGGISNLAQSAAGGGGVTLSWTAPSNSSIAGYDIYRNNVLIGTTTTASYTDAGGALNSYNTYFIVAYNSSGVVFGYLGAVGNSRLLMFSPAP